jgi:hypothetical protein
VHSLMRPSEGGYPMRSCQDQGRGCDACLARFSCFSVWHLDLDSQRLSSEEEMKMNRELKSRWVAALRSGDYKQARERLRRNGSHCCLGVLCDLFAKEGGKAWRTKELSEAGPFQDYDPQGFPDKNMPGATVLVWAQVDPSVKVRIGETTVPDAPCSAAFQQRVRQQRHQQKEPHRLVTGHPDAGGPLGVEATCP